MADGEVVDLASIDGFDGPPEDVALFDGNVGEDKVEDGGIGADFMALIL